MLQSTSNTSKHISTSQKLSINLILSGQQQQTENVQFSTDQRKVAMENDRKKWDAAEFRDWLCFIVRYALDFPYQDLQDVLMTSKNVDKIYSDLSRTIQTKNSKQCFKFSRKMIKEMRNRTDQGLLSWCISKLKKQIQHPKIVELLSEYEAFTQQKSAYMKILNNMDQFYDKEELQVCLD